jgi:hypothetical protein
MRKWSGLIITAALLVTLSTNRSMAQVDPGAFEGAPSSVATFGFNPFIEPAESTGIETAGPFSLSNPFGGPIAAGALILCERTCYPANAQYSNWRGDSINWSDEILWLPNQPVGTGLMMFLSDPNTWVDPNFGVGFRILEETALFGSADIFGAQYNAGAPSADDPQHIVLTQYTFVSDQGPEIEPRGVPEPGSFLLFLSGLVSLFLFGRIAFNSSSEMSL